MSAEAGDSGGPVNAPAPVYRFAPSPNGFLHRGHGLSAMLNHDAAGQTGGRMLLRIEDIDTLRARPEFEDAILEDLDWLGLSWPQPILRQSRNTDRYRQAISELDNMGLVYPAFLSRRQIREAAANNPAWPADPDGAPFYPGPERDWSRARRRREMEAGKPYALRLDLARALTGVAELTWQETDPAGDGPTCHPADPAIWSDIVLAGRETAASYHLSVCVDDADQGVTRIVRGLDLRPATAIHRLIQHLLGLPEPVYHHHRLVLNPDGSKLSKSEGGEAIRHLRAAGWSPQDVRRSVGL